MPLCCEQIDQLKFADDKNFLCESHLLNILALNDELNAIALPLAENKLRLNSSRKQLTQFYNISLDVTLGSKTLNLSVFS